MKVVLLSHIQNGAPGDVKEVKVGYAKNFLFPKGLAVPMGYPGSEQIVEKAKKKAEKEAAQKLESEAKVKEWNNKEVSFLAKSTKTGKLYGGITAEMIAKEAGIAVENIEPVDIKSLGEHKVGLVLHGSKVGELKVVVGPKN